MRLAIAVLFGIAVTGIGVLLGNVRFEQQQRAQSDAYEAAYIQARRAEYRAEYAQHEALIVTIAPSQPATTSAFDPPAPSDSISRRSEEELLNRSNPAYLQAARAISASFVEHQSTSKPLAAQWEALADALIKTLVDAPPDSTESGPKAIALSRVSELRRRAIDEARATLSSELENATDAAAPIAAEAPAAKDINSAVTVDQAVAPPPAAAPQQFAAETSSARRAEAQPASEPAPPPPPPPQKEIAAPTQAEKVEAQPTSEPRGPSVFTKLNDAVSRFFLHLIENPQVLLPFLLGTVYYLVMIFGIFTGSMYEGLGESDSKKTVRVKQILRHASTAGTWQGILVSPLIFALMKGAIPDEGFSFSMAFLAFENGFFWRATMKKLTTMREEKDKEKEQEKQPATAAIPGAAAVQAQEPPAT